MQPQEQEVEYTTTKPKSKRLWQLWLAGLILLLIAGGYLAFTLVNQQDVTTESPITVKVTANGFSPSTISVKKGSQITWLNEDTSEHNLLGDQEQLEMSSDEPLNEGDSYSYTFDDTGTFTYHDPMAPTSFKGTVIVE